MLYVEGTIETFKSSFLRVSCSEVLVDNQAREEFHMKSNLDITYIFRWTGNSLKGLENYG